MAQNNKDNVSLGKGKLTGVVYWAPMSATVPTNATSALPAEYHNVGYISEDGVTNSVDSDNTDVNDMNGVKVLNLVSSYSEKYQFTMIETNIDSMKLRYGDDAVTGTTESMTIRHKMPTGVPVRLVFEFLLNGEKPEREVVPNATVSEFDDIQRDSGDVLGYSVTFAANPATELNGDVAVSYIGGTSSTSGPASGTTAGGGKQ